MHLEKSYQQLTLVDDAGKRHDLCGLLAKLCPEVTCNADSKVRSKRTASDQPGDEATGAKAGEEADSKGSASGRKSSGSGGKAASAKTNGQSAKAGKGPGGKAKSEQD